jgi:phosphatidate cytidylyltransferase
VALGNLAQRALVAVVAAPIVLLILYYRRPEATWGLVFIASLLAINELLAMGMKGPEHAGDRRFLLVTGGLACAALYWFHPLALVTLHPSQLTMSLAHVGPLLAMVIGVVVPGLYFLFRFGDMTTAAPRWAYAITAIFYCGFMATTLAMAKRDFGIAGGDVVLLILLLAWIGDTGAYFAGRFLGKSKLYPQVSPKKTWAGACGGLAGSLAAAAVMKVLRFDHLGGQLSWLDVALIAIPGGILGQLGDLVESLVKRSVGVKDSGALLPGHGGMLDRIDAVLFIGPYVYLYLTLAL